MTHKPTVLIVGEGLDEAPEICTKLQAADCEVFCASSFAEGVACLDQQLIDFVIVSQGTRSFEGRSVLTRAIEKDRYLPVLVVARSVDMNVYLEAMHLGAWDYLEEPISAELILKSVTARVSGRAQRAQSQRFLAATASQG
jgi:DNA-binding NtrC family response regulator